MKSDSCASARSAQSRGGSSTKQWKRRGSEVFAERGVADTTGPVASAMTKIEKR